MAGLNYPRILLAVIIVSLAILVSSVTHPAYATNHDTSMFSDAQKYGDSNTYKNVNYSFSIQPPINWVILNNLPHDISPQAIVVFSNNNDKSQTLGIYHRHIDQNVIDSIKNNSDNDLLAADSQGIINENFGSQTTIVNGIIDRYNDGMRFTVSYVTRHISDNTTSSNEKISYFLNNGNQYTLELTNSQLLDSVNTFLVSQTNSVGIDASQPNPSSPLPQQSQPNSQLTSVSTTSQQQVESTSKGTIQVGFSISPANPNPGDQTELKIIFLSKQNTVQQHIDYKVSIIQGENHVFGTPVTHTAEGKVSIPFQFQTAGIYQVTVEVQGILFQPISPEVATFPISIGTSQNPIQMTPTIMISTDNSTYNNGETITVSGNIQHAVAGTPTSLVITNPSNKVVYQDSVMVNLDGSFSEQIPTSEKPWNNTGTYQVVLQYGSSNISGKTSFFMNYNIPATRPVNQEVVDKTKQILAETPENFGSDNASTISFKCQAFVAFKSWIQAYNYCDKALGLDPSNTTAQNGKDVAYNNMTGLVSNIIQADNTLKKNPNDEYALTAKAGALISLGKYLDSLSYLNQILKLDPSNTDILLEKTATLYHLGEYSEAFQIINSSSSRSIDYPLTIAILYNMGKYDETLLYIDEDFNHVLADQSSQYSKCKGSMEKALVYEKMGLSDMANGYYQLAMTYCNISTDELEFEKANYYAIWYSDFQKGLEHLGKISTDSPYYQVASYMKVIDDYDWSEIRSNLKTDTPTSISTTLIITPTQQDIQNINQAKANQTIAAEINVGNNKTETTSIDNNVSVQTTSTTPDSLGVTVSASSQTGPKVIAFNLAATTINVENLKDLGVMYDGKPISPAPNMDAILHAKSTDNPSFAIVVTQSGVQVLVLVPHFSSHTITLTNMSKVIPAVPEFPFAILALIIATFSIILIPQLTKQTSLN